jgi:predicted TIM-barrel fold metal-dependent hydrolase
MHAHIPSAQSEAGRSWRTADVVQRLDRLGVTESVIMTIDGFAGNEIAANDALALIASESGGRLIPLCTVDPQDPGASAEIRRCVTEGGFRAIKLHPWAQGFAITEDYMTPVANVAAELDVPIIVHDGTPPATSPLQIALFAERHPATHVVLGHGGLMDMWLDAAAAVRRNSNMSVILAGTSPLEIFAKVIELVGTERVCLGTDTRYELDDEYTSAMRLERIRIILDRYSPAEAGRLAAGNARAMLSLSA